MSRSPTHLSGLFARPRDRTEDRLTTVRFLRSRLDDSVAGWVVGKRDDFATSGRGQSRRATVFPAIVAFWLGASVLALGGAPYWFGVLTMSLVPVCAVFFVNELQRGWSVLSTLLCGLAGYTALQLIPWPLHLLRIFAPGQTGFWSALHHIPAIEAPKAFGALSLDPGATALEVLKWSSYAMMSAATGWIARNRGLSVMLGIVAAVGTALSIVGLGHVLISAVRVFGVYTPITPRPVIGPLVNPNHFAAYANLSALLCAGLALSGLRRSVRACYGFALAANVVASFVSASRGGVISLLVGLAVLTVLSLAIRQKEQKPLSPGPLLVVLGGLIALGVFSLSSARSRELFDADLSKIQLLPRTLDAISEYALFGVGRGAFETVAFRYFPELGGIVLRSVESLPVSVLVEWGVPVGGTTLLVLVWLLRPGRLQVGESVRRAGAWVALGVVLLQNLLDIGLELPSLSLAFWGVWGALESSRMREDEVGRAGPLRSPRLPVVALAVAACAAVASLLLGPNAFERRRALHSRFMSGSPEFSAMARASLVACPADPYFSFLLGLDALKQGRDPLAWGAVTLRRAPRYGRAHLLVGRSLLLRGATSQAIVEFRQAMENDESLIADGVRAGLLAAHSDDEIMRLAPPGAHRALVLLEIFRSLPAKDRALLRRRLLLEGFALSPRQPAILEAVILEHVLDLELNAAPCSGGARCPLASPLQVRTEIQENLARYTALRPASCFPSRVRARLLEFDGRAREAEQLLARDCAACTEVVVCTSERLALADRIGDARLTESAELAFRSAACDSPETCARVEEHMARRAGSRGDSAAAAGLLFKAAAQSPTQARWLAAARGSLKARMLARAEDAYQRARALGARDDDIEKQLSQLRRTSLHELLQRAPLDSRPSP